MSNYQLAVRGNAGTWEAETVEIAFTENEQLIPSRLLVQQVLAVREFKEAEFDSSRAVLVTTIGVLPYNATTNP